MQQRLNLLPSLTHPNIVSIYDVGNEGSLYYIVMELVKGKTLKEIINEDGPLPWKWSVNIAIQVASALEMAHRNRIIHRDIKPHNIIITEDGIAKVTDFGIAKAVSNSTITAFGTTIGSVHYFSPEHARGGYTDAKSDLYSLGVVMYEMLTGKVPFDADTPVSIALKHMQETPIEPIEENPEIPIAVNNIIMKAMKKDANMRYHSATEMLKDLNKALKDPNGNFVYIQQNESDFATQKIPIYNNIPEEDHKVQNRNQKQEKKSKFKEFIKKHKKLSFVIGAILLFFLAFGGTALIFNIAVPKDIELPNFVGMTKEEAEEKAKELKLKLVIKSEEYDPTLEEGKIISQDPKYIEGYHVKEKSEIQVVVSKGQETTTMPKITGLSKEDALKAIEEANLVAEVSEEISKKVEEGYVISQDPTANTQIAAGSTVKVVVSKGTGIVNVTVPSVVGKTQEEATNELTTAKLKVNVAYDEDTTKDNGIVLKQSIDVGKTVEEGTSITITVNKIAELKNATIKVNLKSLLNYTESSNANTTEIERAKVKIVAGNDTIHNESHKKTETNITSSFSARGTVIVKVYVDDVLKGTKELNLNSETSYTFE